MTYHGHVRNGRITLDEPARLPEGALVKVEVLERLDAERAEPAGDGLAGLLLRHAGKGQGLPADLAAHHDRYAHGKPGS